MRPKLWCTLYSKPMGEVRYLSYEYRLWPSQNMLKIIRNKADYGYHKVSGGIINAAIHL